MSKILAFNWKMNPTTRKDVDHLTQALAEAVGNTHESQVIVFPPAVYLSYLQTKQSDPPLYVELGVQNISTETVGAFTGQISASMLADMSIPYALIGHSETRKHLHYTNDDVQKITHQALRSGLIPMICIGYGHNSEQETVDYEALRQELISAISGNEELLRAGSWVIAYEPIWAIGTGISATPEIIQTVAIFIKRTVRELLGDISTPIVYGGSVSSKNIEQFLTVSELNGFLVGGASLDSNEISALVSIMG